LRTWETTIHNQTQQPSGAAERPLAGNSAVSGGGHSPDAEVGESETGTTGAKPASTLASRVRDLGRQPALDGVRGLAVLLVVCTHFGLPLPSGGIGVDIFFVLSGFLITTLLLTERDRSGTISFSKFYMRRVRRLMPALVLMLIGFAIAQHYFGFLATSMSLGWAVLIPLFFASNWVALFSNANALNAINPTWSLSVEEQFYLLWPLALFVVIRKRVRPLLIVGVLAVLCVCLVAFADWLPWRYRWMSIYFNPFDRGAELLFGCIAAFLWRYRYVPRILSWRPLGWIALVLLLWMAKHGQLDIHQYFAYFNLAPWADIQAEYIGAALLGFVLLLSVTEHPNGDLASLFKLSPLRYIGKISYGIYLFHLPTISIIRDLMPTYTDKVRAPLAFVIVLAMSTASWYLLEAPIQRWGRRGTAAGRKSEAARPPVADNGAPPVPPTSVDGTERLLAAGDSAREVTADARTADRAGQPTS
jgi:peptidoglycan/LPS O-acetylase OafA/YrhL